jgi:hypothetical protein
LEELKAEREKLAWQTYQKHTMVGTFLQHSS